MDFKIRIECCKCCCIFELRSDNFTERETLKCPNCSQDFPKEYFNSIKVGLNALKSVPESIPINENPFDDKKHFTLHVKEWSILDKF
jgi:hypothetical protein